MAKWTQASRKAYHKEHPENFAGPDLSFPIKDGGDVKDAWNLAGHGDNPDVIRRKIKSIAKRLGLTASLPGSAKEDDGKGAKRAMDPVTSPTDDAQTTVADAEPEGDVQRSLDPQVTAQHMYVPITRIDKDEWVIEGQATNDAIDAYGTIFDYESSKRAFQDWRGNIREMHQGKAVGRAIEWTPDDTSRAITVRARISKGARDTWEKICDGTLSGFSIALPQGGYKVKTIERNGKSVPMYYDHKLAEVSVVDNPGNPACDIAIVRADGMITDVLDDAEPVATPEPETDTTRAGARVSHATQSDLHGLRDSQLQGAKNVMGICGCDECKTGASALDPDNDGDIDLMPTSMLDWDSDGGSKDMMAGMRSLEPVVERALAPTITRMNAIAARLAAYDTQTAPTTIDTSAIERRLDAIEQAVPGIAEVRSLVSEVKELAEQIAAQPQSGGPFASGAAMDKMLATRSVQPEQQLSRSELVQQAMAAGLLKNMTQEQQTVAAAMQIRDILPNR